MELIIITGLSGSGKSKAINTLEDIGFFCVDNMPPSLISKFAQIGRQSKGTLERIAVVTDTRGGELFEGLFHELEYLKKNHYHYKLLFLDASDDVLLHRFKETRRKHPLIGIGDCTSLDSAIAKERSLLTSTKEIADYIIDTTLLTSSQLKERICKLFLENIQSSMIINCMSFGFKYGVPTYADLVFDVRCLPNPFYVDELRPKTGLEQPVKEYVLQYDESNMLIEKLKDLLDFLIPLYVKEGKSELTIAFGCTGGKHRSVTFAETFYNYLNRQGNRVSVIHRDIEKGKG